MLKKLLLLVVLTSFITSCSEDCNERLTTYHRDFIIDSDEWRWYDPEGYFYYEVPIPELTRYVYLNGVISVYYVTVIDGIEVTYPLPYDYYQMDTGYRWTEQSTCEISPGMISFITQYNNFDSSMQPPTLKFRVKMMW